MAKYHVSSTDDETPGLDDIPLPFYTEMKSKIIKQSNMTHIMNIN